MQNNIYTYFFFNWNVSEKQANYGLLVSAQISVVHPKQALKTGA